MVAAREFQRCEDTIALRYVQYLGGDDGKVGNGDK
jgi:hypothetical protein